MIIEGITIKNFGLFKEEQRLVLTPSLHEERNIILISGQNGVGKSTILEAIHLSILGSLAIDARISEANYENYLYKRAYRSSLTGIQETKLELDFNFTKSGLNIKYKIIRRWMNDPDNVNEEINILENGRELIELTKKEKNLFLRELIQPGFTKVMFFDGEKLSALFEGNHLTQFIGDSCRYLFGLNFIDLLKSDLNYYTNKLHLQQDNSQSIAELNKLQNQLNEIEDEYNHLLHDNENTKNHLLILRDAVHSKEEEISNQGRWVTKKLDKIKTDRQKLETSNQTLKKDLIELYGALGPFTFCKSLTFSLKKRLLEEREIEKWEHAKEMLNNKFIEIQVFLNKTDLLEFDVADKKTRSALYRDLKRILMAKPDYFSGDDIIHHELSDSDRTKLVSWIDTAINVVSIQLKEKSLELVKNEEKLKQLNKEQFSFSKEDHIQPLLKELQELNKQAGASEQRLETITKKIQDAERRKDYYVIQYSNLQTTLTSSNLVAEKIRLSEKTKIVLEEYAQVLLTKRVKLLEEKVLEKFNILCRKQNYFDRINIDLISFEIMMIRNNVVTEHTQLSAGEKQLLILSFLWGLRELTTIALPLIIDTPLARLDYEHRKSFLNKFLPAMYPQVILIGTDMEVLSDVMDELDLHIVRHYTLTYDNVIHGNKIHENNHITESIAI